MLPRYALSRCATAARIPRLTARTYAAVTPNRIPPTEAKPRGGPDGSGPPQATSTAAAQPFSAALTPGPVKVTAEAPVTKSSVPPGTALRNINYFKNKGDPVAKEDAEYPAWLWSTLETKQGDAVAADVGDLYAKGKKARRIAKKRLAKLAALGGENPEVKIPINEQTIDLPFATVADERTGPRAASKLRKTVAAVGGVGVVESQMPAGAKAGKAGIRPSTVTIGEDVQVTAEQAIKAREELKREMRKKSRAGIKERNFLSQM